MACCAIGAGSSSDHMDAKTGSVQHAPSVALASDKIVFT
jgi:hypothetical protein